MPLDCGRETRVPKGKSIRAQGEHQENFIQKGPSQQGGKKLNQASFHAVSVKKKYS